jgi:hypothetical protein
MARRQDFRGTRLAISGLRFGPILAIKPMWADRNSTGLRPPSRAKPGGRHNRSLDGSPRVWTWPLAPGHPAEVVPPAGPGTIRSTHPTALPDEIFPGPPSRAQPKVWGPGGHPRPSLGVSGASGALLEKPGSHHEPNPKTKKNRLSNREIYRVWTSMAPSPINPQGLARRLFRTHRYHWISVGDIVFRPTSAVGDHLGGPSGVITNSSEIVLRGVALITGRGLCEDFRF